VLLVAQRLYKASIPGSLMLLGEHAVLCGSHAVVCAINRYITGTLIPRSDQIININSSLFGECQQEINNINIVPPFQYILMAIETYSKRLKCGFDLLIESEISPQVGLGSSAAATVATLSVLKQLLCSQQPNSKSLFNDAKLIIQKVQGTGSGADVAASTFGGVIAYRMEPLIIKQLVNTPPLVVIYSGNKVLTKDVVQQVTSFQDKHKNLFHHLYDSIDECVQNAIEAINNGDWSRLGELMNIHQGIQDSMGVNNKILSELIFTLRQHPDVHGAKISGAGLGDCVIGLGNLPNNYFPDNKEQRALGVQQLNGLCVAEQLNVEM
jgi:mevalonate kinase